VAVDDALVTKDMFHAERWEHDQRVVARGWTYYVQATRRPGRLGRAPLSSDSLIGDLLIVLPLELFLDWRARGRPWTIGVVRSGYIGTWNEQRWRVVHRETCTDADPTARIGELVADAAGGRFHPDPSE
jgi:hypothetical protein